MRRALLGLAFVVLGAPLLLLAAAAIVGSTPAGQRRLAAEIVARVNPLFAGRVALERAAVGLDGIELEGVRVWAPGEEEPFLEADRAFVAPALAAPMLQGRVRVYDARIEGGRMSILSPADGGPANVARAFAPRSGGAGGGGSATPWEVVVDRLALERVALVVGTSGAPPLVDLSEGALEVRGRIDAEGAEVRGVVSAALAAPVRGRASLAIEGALADGFRHVEVRRLDGRFGGSTVAFSGAADLPSLSAEVRELQARLLPEDVPGLVDGWSPTAALRVAGEARFANGTLAATLDLAQEAGDDVVSASAREGAPPPRHLRVEGELQPVAGAWRVQLRGAALDPRGFDARAPAGAVDLAAALQGTGLGALAGTIDLPAIALGEAAAGPVHVDASWQDERLDLRAVRAQIAGGSVAASGWTGTSRGDVRFDLDAKNARQLVASVRALAAAAGVAPPELPAVQGGARIRGRVHGNWARPSLDADVRAATLAVGGARFDDLQAKAELSGLPAAPSGVVTARLGALRAGSTQLAAVGADLRLAGNRVSGTLDGSTPAGHVRADVDLTAAKAWQELRFDRLDLAWPSATWRLRRHAIVALADGVRVEGLSLASNHGATLEADGALRANGRIALDLRAGGVNLGRLPPALAPAELGLAGVASARAQLQGTLARPRGEMQVQLAGGAIGGIDGIDARADLRLDGKSVLATWQGNHGAAAFDGEGRLPWPIDRKAPLQVDARLRELDLGEVARLLALPEPLAGTVQADVRLEGTLADPRGTIDVQGSELALRGVEHARAGLNAELGRQVVVNASASAGTGNLGGTFTFGASAAALVERPEAILDAPLTGTLDAKALEIARLAFALAPAPDDAGDHPGLRGSLGVEAQLEGTLRRPRGTARLALADAWNGRIGPLDADVTVHATDASSRVELASKLLGKPFLSGSVDVMAALERLLEPAALRSTALHGEIAARSLEVGAIAWAFGYREEAAGTVSGTLRLAGTTGAPRVDLAATTSGLALGGVDWGEVDVSARYLDRKLGGGVALRGAAGGDAELRGTWPVDLSLPAIGGGSVAALASAPLDLAFTAHALDLRFLEGLSPDLRQAEGILDGQVLVRGPRTLPAFDGALALREGRFGWTGLGEIRQVALELELQPDAIRLRRFEGQSSGTVRVSGAATRAGASSPYALDFAVESQRFAITTSDLVRGWLDADAHLTGTAGTAGIDANLSIARAQIELANTPSKDVQSLDPHPDFVIVRGGAAVVRRKQVRARGPSDFPVVVAVVSEQPIEIRGPDVQIEASSDLKILLPDGNLQLVGAVQVESGHVLVMSRRFEFARGRVYYTGAEEPGDPRLDVVAQHESPYALVTVSVGGTARKPTTNLRANPPMSEAEIANLLATGRPQLQAGSGGVSEMSGAASAVGALLTTQLKKGIAAKLPLDVISFETNEGFASSRLEAGTYVTDRIYLGYARRFENASASQRERERENANEVRLEYQLAPRWSLEVTYGDANVGGADLFWTRDF